jgi:hypothetical protein
LLGRPSKRRYSECTRARPEHRRGHGTARLDAAPGGAKPPGQVSASSVACGNNLAGIDERFQDRFSDEELDALADLLERLVDDGPEDVDR